MNPNKPINAKEHKPLPVTAACTDSPSGNDVQKSDRIYDAIANMRLLERVDPDALKCVEDVLSEAVNRLERHMCRYCSQSFYMPHEREAHVYQEHRGELEDFLDEIDGLKRTCRWLEEGSPTLATYLDDMAKQARFMVHCTTEEQRHTAAKQYYDNTRVVLDALLVALLERRGIDTVHAHRKLGDRLSALERSVANKCDVSDFGKARKLIRSESHMRRGEHKEMDIRTAVKLVRRLTSGVDEVEPMFNQASTSSSSSSPTPSVAVVTATATMVTGDVNAANGTAPQHMGLLYKSKMCKNWEKSGKCPLREKCKFAHGDEELRSGICKYYLLDNSCRKGRECKFKHVAPTTL